MRWLETNVSEAVMPPSSGLRFVIMDITALLPTHDHESQA